MQNNRFLNSGMSSQKIPDKGLVITEEKYQLTEFHFQGVLVKY